MSNLLTFSTSLSSKSSSFEVIGEIGGGNSDENGNQNGDCFDKYNVNYEFGKTTLKAGHNSHDDCGSNGLPTTPNSISIIGNFRAIVDSISHPNISQYVDCYRSKNEKVCLVFEYYQKSFSLVDFDNMVSQLLTGLHFLHLHLNIVHGNITPEAIVFNGINYKWIHWPLNVITEFGRYLDCSALLPRNLSYVPPERAINLKSKPCKRSDIWSFGLIVLSSLYPEIKLPRNPVTLAACKTVDEVLKRLNVTETLPAKWSKYQQVISQCLNPKVNLRPTVNQLMQLLEIEIPNHEIYGLDKLIKYNKIPDYRPDECPLTIREAYHFWCLSSTTNRDKDCDEKQEPPILRLPSLVILESSGSITNYSNNSLTSSSSSSTITTSSTTNTSNTQSSSSSSIASSTSSIVSFVPHYIEVLPMDNLKRRLNELDPTIIYPLISTRSKNEIKSDTESPLPIIIRENDFTYQVERTLLFRRLCNESPFLRDDLLKSSAIDIPPAYRAQAWAVILEVDWNDLLIYDKIDKLTPTSTDRQISVDIPRCHQYNDLLASPKGHKKFSRILKAWLRHNEPHYVYWQGLDSLSAPFVLLNFNDEPMAFASFNAFIHKYLRGFFSKDNSQTIQEYLALFSHLIAFHDVNLFNHLYHLNFTPELYCIPWFLTMFTHVLPLHKIFHVWDTLLLGDESFPLSIGLSILKQLRDQLGYTFNDCILISSDLPEINIDQCVQDAIQFVKTTPPSATKRGLFPTNELVSEICPRITMDDLIDAWESGERVIIVDRRSEDDLIQYGSIEDAIREYDINIIKTHTKEHYYLLAVINDLPLAAQLVLESVGRTVSVLHEHKIPYQLKISSNVSAN
ncbi:TBC domain-containing protein kinase-like protein [Panonychus citri]|uniref:TBC domain-containing protein kinase-like protein n=1 Tax=Panonychus citri TaxID=50023 RepID=UPI00230719B1|nr:TBC domain-containing protein kinase-like protein [Panonychus citri]